MYSTLDARGAIISGVTASLAFRWLGCAGVELRAEGAVLAVDPFFTRPSMAQFFFGRAISAESTAAEKLPRCDYLLGTHAHHDHIMDFPAVVRTTGAQVYGSPNVCRLSQAGGAPAEKLNCVKLGDHLSLGPFEVDVLPAAHMDTPVDVLIKGPLAKRLNRPLRLLDFHLDVDFSFLIRAAGRRVLIGNAPTPADWLFTIPFNPAVDLATLLHAVRPCMLVPIHWDDFFRPLSAPLRPSYRMPSFKHPMLKRINLDEFARLAHGALPDLDVLVPEMFAVYQR